MSNLEQSRTDNENLNNSLISNNDETQGKGENESYLSDIYKKTMNFMGSK